VVKPANPAPITITSASFFMLIPFSRRKGVILPFLRTYVEARSTSTERGVSLLFVAPQPDAASALRTVPTQERSRRTVSTILDAASELLRDGGPDALTTSALAERTGLRVRNVYRYFRDRQAVMATLAERMNSRIESAIADVAGLSDPACSLEQVVDELVERVMTAAASEPAGVQVRAAMRTSRELQAIDADSDRRIAHLLADGLRQRGIRARRNRLEAGLFVLVTAIGAVLDRAALDSDERDQATLVREVKRMAHAYIQTLIGL
jgi:AcrR family transcriptional regulator